MAVGYKPYQTKASELKPEWHVVDADGKTLGRLSSEIAVLLQGKGNPMFTQVAEAIGQPDEVESVHKLLAALAANGRVKSAAATTPTEAAFSM